MPISSQAHVLMGRFRDYPYGVGPQAYGGSKRGTTHVVDDIVRYSKKLERQLAIVITYCMNSLYGGTANKYFAYYIGAMAEAITTSGQLSIRWAAKDVNSYLNKVMKTENVDYVAYIDTDSLHLNCAPLIEKIFGSVDVDYNKAEKILDDFFKNKIEPMLEESYDELARKMGAYRNAMFMKREKINSTSLYTGKKRYVLNTLNNEGVHYDTPKISVTGIESVRSSTPAVCREKMKEMFKIVMSKDEKKAQEFIADFFEEFKTLPAADIAKNSGLDDINKFYNQKTIYIKGTPIHVRGALLYNHYVQEKGLTNKYELISSGDKIQFVYLKLPNPIRENIITFPGTIPKEFNLDGYIDHDTQFEKVFLKPMQNIFDAVNWSTEQLSTLEDFFS